MKKFVAALGALGVVMAQEVSDASEGSDSSSTDATSGVADNKQEVQDQQKDDLARASGSDDNTSSDNDESGSASDVSALVETQTEKVMAVGDKATCEGKMASEGNWPEGNKAPYANAASYYVDYLRCGYSTTGLPADGDALFGSNFLFKKAEKGSRAGWYLSAGSASDNSPRKVSPIGELMTEAQFGSVFGDKGAEYWALAEDDYMPYVLAKKYDANIGAGSPLFPGESFDLLYPQLKYRVKTAGQFPVDGYYPKNWEADGSYAWDDGDDTNTADDAAQAGDRDGDGDVDAADQAAADDLETTPLDNGRTSDDYLPLVGLYLCHPDDEQACKTAFQYLRDQANRLLAYLKAADAQRTDKDIAKFLENSVKDTTRDNVPVTSGQIMGELRRDALVSKPIEMYNGKFYGDDGDSVFLGWLAQGPIWESNNEEIMHLKWQDHVQAPERDGILKILRGPVRSDTYEIPRNSGRVHQWSYNHSEKWPQVPGLINGETKTAIMRDKNSKDIFIWVSAFRDANNPSDDKPIRLVLDGTEDKQDGMSTGAFVALIICLVIILALVIVVVVILCKKKSGGEGEEESGEGGEEGAEDAA